MDASCDRRLLPRAVRSAPVIGLLTLLMLGACSIFQSDDNATDEESAAATAGPQHRHRKWRTQSDTTEAGASSLPPALGPAGAPAGEDASNPQADRGQTRPGNAPLGGGSASGASGSADGANAAGITVPKPPPLISVDPPGKRQPVDPGTAPEARPPRPTPPKSPPAGHGHAAAGKGDSKAKATKKSAPSQ